MFIQFELEKLIFYCFTSKLRISRKCFTWSPPVDGPYDAPPIDSIMQSRIHSARPSRKPFEVFFTAIRYPNLALQRSTGLLSAFAAANPFVANPIQKQRDHERMIRNQAGP